MAIKNITIPEPVVCVEPSTKKPLKRPLREGEVLTEGQPHPDADPVTLSQLITYALSDPKWSKTFRMIKTAFAIDKALTGELVPGTVVPLAEDDWLAIKAHLEDPGEQGYGFNPILMPQLFPLLDSVLSAK